MPTPGSTPAHVAIIGGGYSGTLQAVQLIARGIGRVTLIERGARVGRGLAYGAAQPEHLLNVAASGMSAFPDQPDHFVHWLAANDRPEGADDFAPRLVFGDYVRSLLDTARASGRLTNVAGEARDVTREGHGVTVTLADGRTIDADRAILAIGNLPPADPRGFSGLPADRYKSDPWDPSVLDPLEPGDTVALIGTGLTMIDIALALRTRGFGGRIVALSRRGLVPRRHGDKPACQRTAEAPRLALSHLLGALRRRGEAIGWRNAVDELRPFTQDMWAAADARTRRRFLRHLRPWWDVHRHRLAPRVADRLAAMQSDGQLEMVSGKIQAVTGEPAGIAIRWRARGQDRDETLVAQRVVNCTGPQGDLTRIADPLLATLHRRGVLSPDSERIGIDVDAAARTIAADGTPNDWLYAVGPMTKGAFWEIVAVPDIRHQVADVAARLAAG